MNESEGVQKLIDDATIALMCKAAREEHGDPRRVIADLVSCTPQNIKAFEEDRSHYSGVLYAYLLRYPSLREALFFNGGYSK